MHVSSIKEVLLRLKGENVCIHFAAAGVEIVVEELADQVTSFNFFARIEQVGDDFIQTQDVRSTESGRETRHLAYIPINKIIAIRTTS